MVDVCYDRFSTGVDFQNLFSPLDALFDGFLEPPGTDLVGVKVV